MAGFVGDDAGAGRNTMLDLFVSSLHGKCITSSIMPSVVHHTRSTLFPPGKNLPASFVVYTIPHAHAIRARPQHRITYISLFTTITGPTYDFFPQMA